MDLHHEMAHPHVALGTTSALTRPCGIGVRCDRAMSHGLRHRTRLGLARLAYAKFWQAAPAKIKERFFEPNRVMIFETYRLFLKGA